MTVLALPPAVHQVLYPQVVRLLKATVTPSSPPLSDWLASLRDLKTLPLTTTVEYVRNLHRVNQHQQ